MRTDNALFDRMLGCDPNGRLAKDACRVAVRAGEILCRPEESVTRVIFPETALISLATVMPTADSLETALVGRRGGLAVVEAASSGVSFGEAVCAVGGEVVTVPAEPFRAAINPSSALQALLRAHAELLLIDARQALACAVLHKGRARVAWWLAEASDGLGGVETVPVSQSFVAGRLALQRTTINAIATELEDAGAIRTRRGRFIICDRERLEQEACACLQIGRTVRARLDAGGETAA